MAAFLKSTPKGSTAYNNLVTILLNQYPEAKKLTTNVFTVTFIDIRIKNSINCVTKNKDLINNVAKEYGVPSEVIAGIILKEMFTQSLPDGMSILYRKYIDPEKGITVGLGAVSVEGARRAWLYYDNRNKTNMSANLPTDHMNFEVIEKVTKRNGKTTYRVPKNMHIFLCDK